MRLRPCSRPTDRTSTRPGEGSYFGLYYLPEPLCWIVDGSFRRRRDDSVSDPELRSEAAVGRDPLVESRHLPLDCLQGLDRDTALLVDPVAPDLAERRLKVDEREPAAQRQVDHRYRAVGHVHSADHVQVGR